MKIERHDRGDGDVYYTVLVDADELICAGKPMWSALWWAGAVLTLVPEAGVQIVIECAAPAPALSRWPPLLNSPSEDDEDNEIPIEKVVREEIAKCAPSIEWITRYLDRAVVSFDHCLWFLNELVKVDPEAMRKLVETRVPCNEAMADHPTVQVQAREEMDGIPGEVGFLGVLNGLFGAFRDGGPKDGWGQLAAVFEEDGRLSGFRRTKDPGVKPVEVCDSCGGKK